MKQKLLLNRFSGGGKLIKHVRLAGLSIAMIYSLQAFNTYAEGIKRDKAINTTHYLKANIFVKGKVTSKSDGEALTGVSVKIKGSSVGVATDVNGNYTLQAPENGTLVVSYIGFETAEVAVSNRTTINIALQPSSKELSDVIIIGYGTTTKRNITTAVTKVDPKNIPQAANNSVGQLLFGRAAGVQVSQASTQPGGNINISIRGRDNPLYVVDGVVFAGDGLEPGNGTIAGETNGVNRGGLAGINPSDIESIEVLKDASAAIYGVNAANGVILITTKKGKAGRMNITYNGSYSFEKNYQYLQPLNATQYETLYNQITGAPAKYSATDIANAGAGTNWLNQIFQTGAINNHVVNISGGTDKTTYYLSGAYYDEAGTLKGSGLTKITGRANLSFNLSKFLTLNTNLAGNSNKYLNSSSGGQTGGSGSQGFGIIQAALGYPANVPVTDANGNYSQFDKITNPVSFQDIQDHTNYHSLSANVSADVKIIPDVLTGHVLFGDTYEDATRNFFVPSTVFYYQQNFSKASLNYNNRENQTMEATLAYKKSFNRLVNVDAVAGFGQYYSTYSSFGSQGQGGKDAIGTTDLSQEAGNIGITSFQSAQKLRSYFARSSFDFVDRYLLTLTYRYDGFSFFFPANKYASFPSASVGWKINNESFMKNITFVDQLKLRASIGTTGKTIDGYAAYGGYSGDGNITFFNNGNPSSSYVTLSRYGIDQPDLQWQKTINKNIGLDFGFFKDRVNGSIDVFKDDITNMLRYSVPAPLSYLSTEPFNGGHQVRQGFDIALNTHNVRNKNFEWNTNINVSHYVYNWVERFKFDYVDHSYQSDTDPVHEIYYFKTSGILQAGQTVPASQPTAGGASLPGAPIFVDVNNDGKLDGNDVFKVNADPKISIGFGNDFHYKQFDLSIFFYGQFDGTGTNYNNAWGDLASIASGTQGGTIQALDAYTSANTSGTRPGVNYIESATGLVAGSDLNLVSTNFVRCRNLTLGYTFNSAFVNKFAKSLRVFADAQNLFIITNYKGVDPEIYNTGVKGGYAPYPMMRTFSFGVKAGF